MNMCGKRDITFIDHTDIIDIERYLNKSKVHLNKSGTTEFAKNVCEVFLQQDWYTADNSRDITLGSGKSLPVLGISNSIPEHDIHYEVIQSDSFRNSDHATVQEDQIFKQPHEIPSNLNRGALLKPLKDLQNIHRKNINRSLVIFTQLNINSLRNIDVLLTPETKTDSPFPSVQFHLEGYVTSYKLGRNANGSGILLYIR